MECKFQADLHLLRATINKELNDHGVMNQGKAQAVFHHQQYQQDGSILHVETLVAVRPSLFAQAGSYYKPNIRVIVNETLLQEPIDTWIVKDFSADERDVVKYMVDLYDEEEPRIPDIETIYPDQEDADPWLPLFYLTDYGIALSDNYSLVTPAISVDTCGNEPKAKGMYPFGRSDSLIEKAQSLEQGFELVDPLAGARLVYASRITE